MDMVHSQQGQKHPSKFQNKKRLNQEQVSLLERSFAINKKLDTELKLKLAKQLGVPPRQVAIWYQNKRARWKAQSLELDYNTMQVKLENALAEKKRLEKDVKQLREELRLAQQMLFALNNNNNNNNNQKVIMETNSGNGVLSCNNNNNSGGTSYCSTSERGCDQYSRFGLLHEEYSYADRHGDDRDRDRDHDHDQQALEIASELYACLVGDGGSAWG